MTSIFLVNAVVLLGAALILIGIFSSLVATRFGAPLLLVFLVVGMLAGEDGPGGLVFNDYQVTYLIGSLALSVILFDGGLRTRLSAFRGALAPSLVLASVGVVLTAAITGAAAYLVLGGFSLVEALLLGGIVASTDAAAVFFLLRAGGLRLQPRVGSVLEIESGTNDPVAVFLAIILTELVLAGEHVPTWSVLTRLGEHAAIGTAIGVAGGASAVWLLNRVDMPGGLHPLFVVACALTIYASSALLGGSGLLAAYLAGLVMANRPVRAYPSIVGFHDAATWLCQIVMFLVLGLLVTPTTLLKYVLPGVVVALALTFVARPATVWLCLWPFGFSGKEKLFISWVGLRGAVSIFLAAIPTLAQVPHSEAFFNVAFFIVLFSLLVQGWSITGMARWLGLALRRTAPSVSRIELDLPGQVEQEMVGYPVGPESLVLGLTRLPSWTRLVLVIRDNEILGATEAGRLREGDYAYFLVPRERVSRLDRLFVESPDVARRIGPILGELALNGDARIGEVAELYGLDVPAEERARTVAEAFAGHITGPLHQGQRLAVGKAMLVARVVEQGRVVRAGLQLDELIDTFVATGLDPPTRLSALARTWRRLLAAGWRRLRARPRQSGGEGETRRSESGRQSRAALSPCPATPGEGGKEPGSSE